MTESPAGLFRGLFETHLHVADLEKAMAFYGEVLGLELGLRQQGRRAAFYWIGSDRSAMLGLWEKPPWFAETDGRADGSGNGLGGYKILPQHLAFAVAVEELSSAIDRLKQRGIELRDFFDRVTDEPSVFGWIPAASIYFKDVDGHLLEFIARLEGEPAPELAVISLTDWRQRSQSGPSS
jgi:lactoylglutathione lyase